MKLIDKSQIAIRLYKLYNKAYKRELKRNLIDEQ